MMKDFSQFESTLKNESQGFINDAIVTTQAKFDRFIIFKKEVEDELGKMLAIAEALRTKISQNFDKDHESFGLLLQKKSTYMECLELKNDELWTTLSKDEISWQKKIE